MNKNVEINERHGGPYDRGSADSYYRRPREPHYFVGDTYSSEKINMENMTEQEIYEYNIGFDENESSSNFKDY